MVRFIFTAGTQQRECLTHFHILLSEFLLLLFFCCVGVVVSLLLLLLFFVVLLLLFVCWWWFVGCFCLFLFVDAVLPSQFVALDYTVPTSWVIFDP